MGFQHTCAAANNDTLIALACFGPTITACLPRLQSLPYQTALCTQQFLQSHAVFAQQGCDAVLALRGKIKAGGWLRTAAKGYAVPIFSVKSTSPDHLTRAVQTILGLQPSPGGLFGAPRGPDAEIMPAALASPAPDFDSSWDHDRDDGETAFVANAHVLLQIVVHLLLNNSLYQI